MMNISVVIISFNCWELLNACLKSLYASDASFKEVIIIDNASSDGTCEQIKTFYKDIKLFENKINIGHSRAVNQGCALSTGNRILLLDADTELKHDCITILNSFLNSNPDVSMVAPKTFLSDGSLQDSAKRFPSPVNGLFGRQSFLTRCFPGNRISKKIPYYKQL